MRQEVDQTQLGLKEGGKYTTFTISSMMACTIKHEIKLVDFDGSRWVFKPKGKRKTFYLDVDDETLLFEGWDLPIKSDMDSGSFRGNACLNLDGKDMTNQEMKEYIDTKNLNPEMKKGLILSVGPMNLKPGNNDDIIVLYPNLAKDLHHGPIEGYLSDGLVS